MKLEHLKGKKILIAGMGIEGKSTYAFLKNHFPRQTIDTTDIKEGSDYLKKQTAYDVLIKSPGIHKSLIKIHYTTATNIFFSEVKGLTIGVTGSKGKSTTASLIFEILKKAGKKVHLVGNIVHKMDPIGSPMLAELDKSNTKDDTWVCELSSYQLDDIQYSPHIAVVTSFFPEHLNFHGNLEEYWKAKKQIVQFSKKSDFFVYNPAFEKLQVLSKETAATGVPFEDFPFDLSIVPLKGEHNLANIRGAVTVGHLMHIKEEIIQDGIRSFHGLPHRLENIGTFNDITFYDDAIATTPEATIQAIKTLNNIGTIFLGGQDRGFDFRELAKLLISKKIGNFVLFPDTGEKIFSTMQNIMENELEDIHLRFNVLHTKSMEEAVKFAYEYTPEESIVLLSTASPSYSVWSGFEEKGNLFKSFVRELGK